MEQQRLSFTKIIKLDDNLIELIADEGVEIDIEMVKEFHDWCFKNLESSFGVLVNKKNSYTYTFEAQMKIGDYPDIIAISVITYSMISQTFTKLISQYPRKNKWNMEIFNDRETAIKWIKEELAKNKGI